MPSEDGEPEKRMRELSYWEAIAEGLQEEMDRDETVFLIMSQP